MDYVVEINESAPGMTHFSALRSMDLPGVVAQHREADPREPLVVGQETAEEVKRWLMGLGWDEDGYVVSIRPAD